MSEQRFKLHPRLAADTHWVCDWPASAVLLMNDTRFPWLVLVPRVPDVVELFQLSAQQQQAVFREIVVLGETMQSLFGADKINTGALGNLVSQLHIHVIARFSDDCAWPGPVWGVGQVQPYAEPVLAQRLDDLRAGLPKP